MGKAKCGSTWAWDDRTLVCDLSPDHPGPVHQDADGEAWSDPRLDTHIEIAAPADDA